MNWSIVFSISLLFTLFILFYIRTKKLLCKLNKYNKKDYENILDFVSKIEKRAANPIEEFHNNEKQKEDWCIVISYNRSEWLKTTIESMNLHEPALKIIVIDNGSDYLTQMTITELFSKNKISKFLLNKNQDVPQWQKSFSISQAIKILTLESINTITISDDDIHVCGPWLEESKGIFEKIPEAKIICLMDDEIQNKIHCTEKEIILNGSNIKIKSTFNCGFFIVQPETIKELGYPPICEGISQASVEDWYYSRQLKIRNWKIAFINKCIHLGYKKSIREAV